MSICEGPQPGPFLFCLAAPHRKTAHCGEIIPAGFERRSVKLGAELLQIGIDSPLFSPNPGGRRNPLNLSFLSAGASKRNALSAFGKFVVMDMGSVSSDGKTLSSKRTDVEEGLLSMGDLVMPKDDIGGGQIIGASFVMRCRR